MEADEKRNLDCLTAPLPEDIEKLKWRGDFDRALKVIDLRLEKDIPRMLKDRLRLEKDILERMPLQYPYSWEAAVSLASKQVEGMSEDEMEAVRQGERVRVYLPIPIEYAQVKNVKLLGTSMEPYTVAPDLWPQRTVCFETTAGAEQEFSVLYEFENHMSYVELDKREVSDIQLFNGRDFSGWLGEQLPHIHFTLYLRSVVEEVVGEEENPLQKAKRIYDYITSHVMYSFVRTYFTITDITGYAASGWKGDCGVQALLFITMCRIAGVPARWQSGLYANMYDIGCHDWAQFYVEPYGWLYADCSFGGGAYREGANERREFYFGNLDPFRIPVNSEFGWKFSPFMKYVRNDPYDNQMGEAEYGDRALRMQEYDTTHEVLEMREMPRSTR